MKKSPSESVLYRKYRPLKFSEVIGQDHVISVLEGSIKTGKIAHAYLFAGSRGTGKTSVARIFAYFNKVNAEDIYEIDAASNTGVDDVRQLNESVNTLPFSSPYKVYIIDEAHMLSKSAFNALLKTLEEPPEHVIFILATTEFEKLPDTVVSRCQAFTFKKPSSATLKKVVIETAKREGFAIEKDSAELIAFLSEGSFRDAHGILQKIISSSEDKKISRVEVERICGAPNSALVNNFLTALTGKDLKSGLDILAKLTADGIDTKIFAKLILSKMRLILLLKYAPELKASMRETVSEDDLDYLERISKEKNAGINSGTIVEFLDAYSKIGYSSIPELPLELALINLISKEKK